MVNDVAVCVALARHEMTCFRIAGCPCADDRPEAEHDGGSQSEQDTARSYANTTGERRVSEVRKLKVMYTVR